MPKAHGTSVTNAETFPRSVGTILVENAAPVIRGKVSTAEKLLSGATSHPAVSHYTGYVYAAISYIATAFASEVMANLVVKNGAKTINGDQSKLYKMLVNPYNDQELSDLLESWVINILLGGVTHLWARKSEATGAYIYFTCLPVGNVTEETNGAGEIKRYRIASEEANSQMIVAVNEVIRTALYNPKSALQGKSPVEAAGDYVLVSEFLASHQKNKLYGGTSISNMYLLKENDGAQMTNEEFRSLKSKFEQATSGVQNAGKSMILRGQDIKEVRLSEGLGDIGAKDINETSIDGILATFGVSRAMIGLESANLNRATAEVQERMFKQNVLTPLIRKFISSLNRWDITELKEVGPKLTYSPVQAISVEDDLLIAQKRNQQADTYSKLIAAGMSETNALVLSGLQEPQPSTQTKNSVSRAKRIENEAKVESYNKTKTGISRINWKKMQAMRDSRITRFEARLDSELISYYNGLLGRIINNLKVANAFGVAELSASQEQERIVKQLEDEAYVLAASAGGAMYEALIENTDTLLKPTYVLGEAGKSEVQAILYKTARSVTTTVSDEVLNIIQTNRDKTSIEIVDLIRGFFNSQVEVWRTLRIATTEAVRINNAVEQTAVKKWEKDTGFTTNAVWQTNSAEPCEFCRAMSGRVVATGTSFVPQGGIIKGLEGGELHSNFGSIEYPPTHPNCKCSLSYEVI